MKKFILMFAWAKQFNRNLYYCNHKKKYFYLGHFIPNKCCDLIKAGKTNSVQEILLNQLK